MDPVEARLGYEDLQRIPASRIVDLPDHALGLGP